MAKGAQSLTIAIGREVKRVDFSNLEALEEQLQLAQTTKRTPIMIADGVGGRKESLVARDFLWPNNMMAMSIWMMPTLSLYTGHTDVAMYWKNSASFFPFHPRLMLSVSLSKAFGANGAAIVVRLTRIWLGALPVPISLVTHYLWVDSAIAAAHIHPCKSVCKPICF